MVVIQSFGFKYGLPTISDYLIDARVLINPFYVDELRQLTGNDKEVIEYIENNSKTKDYLKYVEDILDFVINGLTRDGRGQITISVGCTGGRHRSVFLANKLAEYFTAKGVSVKAVHRDVDK